MRLIRCYVLDGKIKKKFWILQGFFQSFGHLVISQNGYRCSLLQLLQLLQLVLQREQAKNRLLLSHLFLPTPPLVSKG